MKTYSICLLFYLGLMVINMSHPFSFVAGMFLTFALYIALNTIFEKLDAIKKALDKAE
jgi:hypothetical protein